MKTLKPLLWIGLLCFGFSLNAQVNQTMTFSVNDVSTEQTNGKDIIQLKDATLLYDNDYVGEPQLPVVSVNLALPKGQKANNLFS